MACIQRVLSVNFELLAYYVSSKSTATLSLQPYKIRWLDDRQPVCFDAMMKKTLRETQTLRAGCCKAEPKFFAPPQTPFPGVRDGQNLISWRWSLPLPTNPVWWGSMHAISSYRGNRPTNKHTHKHTHTHRTDYNTLRRS